jgi:hypothetical protein
VNGALEATIPQSPVIVQAPPAANGAPVVQAKAAAPVDVGQDPYQPEAQEPQYGDAYWVKATTLYGAIDAQLDGLQKANVANAKTPKTVKWVLLQRAPGVGANAGKGNREADEMDNLGKKNVQVTKQYEYFKFSGVYDSETHQALCDLFYATQAAALANGKKVQVSCQNGQGNDTPYTKPYWTIDPGPLVAVYAPTGNLGAYVGAHINAYNVK